MRGCRALLVRLSLVAMLATLVPASPARGEDSYSQERCSLCHVQQSVFYSPGFVPAEALKFFGEERICYSCHNGTVRDSRGVLWNGAQHPPAAAGGKRCSVCHSPHSKGGWSVLAGTSISIRKGGDALCTKCHPEYARDAGALHRSGFPDGGCAECHRAHGGAGKALLREAGGALCLRCHQRVERAKSGGHPVARGGGAGARGRLPECASCHPAHGKGFGEDAIDSQCRGCHAFGDRAAGETRHPSEAKCTECHSFHERSGSKGKGLRRDDLRPDVLCGGCHAARVADDRNKGREKGTHPTRLSADGKDLCLQCHRIHGGAPGTALLVSAKAYSCLGCHEGQNTISEVAGIVLAHPVFERVKRGRLAAAAKSGRLTLGPAGEIVCRTCHAVHAASAGTPLLAGAAAGKGSCLFCHEGMGRNDHLASRRSAVGPDCLTCHPVHGKRVGAPAGGKAVDAWAEICTACHPRASSHVPGASAGGGRRPADMPGFDARGRKVRAGAISCPTCHEPHGEPRRKRLRRGYASSGFVCTACHRDKETVALTPHDLRGIAGTSVCEPCHRPHGGGPRWMWGVSNGDGTGAVPECRLCHRENGMASAVPTGGHPVDILAPRPIPDKFPQFGASGERVKTGLITCATCHEVHGTGVLLGGEGSGLLLRARAGREAGDVGRVRACVPCHRGKEATHGQADCIWCHPPHEEANAGPDCQACHAMGGKGVARLHAENRKGCGTCHRIHAAKDKVPDQACIECHPKTARLIGSPHAKMGGGPCRVCHPPHAVGDYKPLKRHQWEEFFAPDVPCLRCHHEGGAGPVVANADHPKSRRKVPTTYGAIVTLETPIPMLGRLKEGDSPLFPLFDDAGARMMAGRMGCPTCHDPHAGNTMKGGENEGAAGSYLRDPSGVFLAEICAPCHKDSAGEHARKFHDLPRKSE